MIKMGKLRLAVKLMRDAAYVKRFHTIPLIGDNTVGQHTFGVMAILCAVVPPAVLRPQLLQAALLHDVPEAVAGDIPGPTKRSAPGLREACYNYEAKVLEDAGLFDMSGYLYDYETEWLGLADSLEGWLFCLEQLEMGNRLLTPALDTFRVYTQEKFNDMLSTQRFGDIELARSNFSVLLDTAERAHTRLTGRTT